MLGRFSTTSRLYFEAAYLFSLEEKKIKEFLFTIALLVISVASSKPNIQFCIFSQCELLFTAYYRFKNILLLDMYVKSC